MLSCAAIICNGNLGEMLKSNSKLSWYEEWFMLFEIVWGKTMKRFVDMCSDNNYGIGDKAARSTFDKKIIMVIKCKCSWSMFASFEEDKALKDPTWTSNMATRA